MISAKTRGLKYNITPNHSNPKPTQPHTITTPNQNVRVGFFGLGLYDYIILQPDKRMYNRYKCLNFHLGNLYKSHQLTITFIIGMFGFFSMFIYQMYCANLISIILNTKILPPFYSWETLYDRSEYTIGYVNGSFLDELLKVCNCSVRSLTTFVICIYPTYVLLFRMEMK